MNLSYDEMYQLAFNDQYMIKHLLKILKIFVILLSFSSFAYTKRCYITFSSKGGIGTMVNQECQKGATIKLNSNTYTKDGYYFKYWEDDFGKTYKDQEYITIDKDIHLHATWSKVIYR